MNFRLSPRQGLSLFALLGAALGTMVLNPLVATFAQTGGNDNSRPAPPSVGATVPLTYFGPSPSEVDPQLVGPVKLLKAGQIDEAAGTITLPLYHGFMKDTGKLVWYVLTDTTDKENALGLGLLHSAKLTYADVGRAVRPSRIVKDNLLEFDRGTVDFSPVRNIVPGDAPNAFPPKVAEPGSIGDENYSPLTRIENAGNEIYNAPVIAFDVTPEQINFCNGNVDYSLVHDQVLKICPGDMTVTLKLAQGFSFAKPVFYLSLDANMPDVAAIEDVTFAPGLKDVVVGADDSAFSAIERLFVTTNGPTGSNNPQRQGLNSALTDGGGPLNILGGIPTVALDYSPLWDLNVGEWTQTAIDNDYRSRITEEFQYLGMAELGYITGPGGKPFGSSGAIVNCPVVMRLK